MKRIDFLKGVAAVPLVGLGVPQTDGSPRDVTGSTGWRGGVLPPGVVNTNDIARPFDRCVVKRGPHIGFELFVRVPDSGLWKTGRMSIPLARAQSPDCQFWAYVKRRCQERVNHLRHKEGYALIGENGDAPTGRSEYHPHNDDPNYGRTPQDFGLEEW